MKFSNVIAVSTLCLLMAAPVLAETQVPRTPEQNEPVALQPTPLPPAVAATPNQPVAPPPSQIVARLGDSGTMYTRMRQQQATGELDAAAVAAIAPAAGTPIVNANKPIKTIGGAQMFPTQTISANLAGPSNLTTLVKALDTAGLSSSLAAPTQVTLFAPSNNAFNRLPKNAFNTLMLPANKAKLTKLLNYHVVPGTHDAASIKADIAANGGSASYQTLAGETLKATLSSKGAITITDNNGNRSNIALADAYQSNGVVHVVDRVVIPQ